MKRRKKRKGEFSVPVASMGDIAFLLIIFFVLCSQFQEVDIEPPKSLDAVELNERPKMAVDIGLDGQLYWQGRKVDNPDAIEWAVRGMIESVSQKYANQNKGQPIPERVKVVQVRCDASVHRNIYEPVFEAIARGGGVIAAVGDKGDPDRKRQ